MEEGQREKVLQAKRVATVFQPCPMFWDAAKMRTSRVVFRASTPWSKSSPRGPDCFVRRLQRFVHHALVFDAI